MSQSPNLLETITRNPFEQVWLFTTLKCPGMAKLSGYFRTKGGKNCHLSSVTLLKEQRLFHTYTAIETHTLTAARLFKLPPTCP